MSTTPVTNGSGATILSAEIPLSKRGIGDFIPELLTAGPYAGPYAQIQGHGGDCVLTGATCADSSTSWTGKTVYSGVPIEGEFSAITITSGTLLAYRRRA